MVLRMSDLTQLSDDELLDGMIEHERFGGELWGGCRAELRRRLSSRAERIAELERENAEGHEACRMMEDRLNRLIDGSRAAESRAEVAEKEREEALREADRQHNDRMRAEAEVVRLRLAAQGALNELGVPSDEYPAPVANAVQILSNALLGPDSECDCGSECVKCSARRALEGDGNDA